MRFFQSFNVFFVLTVDLSELTVPGSLDFSHLFLKRLEELGPKDIREILSESLNLLSVMGLLFQAVLELLVFLEKHGHLRGVGLLELIQTSFEKGCIVLILLRKIL
jgi:hypothetical protein